MMVSSPGKPASESGQKEAALGREPPLEVALAAIRDPGRRYLVSLRHQHLLGGGYWEFPGGKIEDGESAEEAVRREVFEELGVEAQNPRFLFRSPPPVDAPARPALSLFEVDSWEGDMRHNDGQPLRWGTVAEIAQMRILPGSLPLLDCLRFGPICCITPSWEPGKIGGDWEYGLIDRLEAIQRASGGERCQLLWRQPGWPPKEQLRVLKPIAGHCKRAGIAVGVSRNIELAQRLGSDFLHLSAKQLAEAAPSSEAGLAIGGAAHNLEEIENANSLGVRYGLISPVKETPSKSGTPPLGWERFGQLASRLDGLAYALGGLALEDLAMARQRGGFGIAGISFWSGEDS